MPFPATRMRRLRRTEALRGLVQETNLSPAHFHDDTVITIDACSIFSIADGKFTDQRIYVDNAPVDSFLV